MTNTQNGCSFGVKSVGGSDLPYGKKIITPDGGTGSPPETSNVWKQPKQATIDMHTRKASRSLTVDDGLWMDANEKDNGWKPAGSSQRLGEFPA